MAGPAATVLVVEDDPDAREALAMLLEAEGYDAEQASNGRDALARLAGPSLPCLVLLDLMMPVMDGWQFLTAKMADPRIAPVPVVVLTAADLSQQSPGALGGVVVLVKPVEPRELLNAVHAHCGR